MSFFHRHALSIFVLLCFASESYSQMHGLPCYYEDYLGVYGGIYNSNSPKQVEFLDDNTIVTLDGGIRIIDVTNLLEPESIGHVRYQNTSINRFALTDDGNYALITGVYPNLIVVDITDRENPFIAYELSEQLPYGDGIFIDGTTAYIAEGQNGMTILDISNMTDIKILGSTEEAIYGIDIIVQNGIAYVQLDGGFSIINVADPSSPHVLSSIWGGCDSHGLAIHQDMLYLASGCSGANFFDVSDPENPVYQGNLEEIEYGTGMQVIGNRLYALDSKNGMFVYDLPTQSTTRELIGSYDTVSDADDLWVRNEVAAVVGEFIGEMRLIDVHDPKLAPIYAEFALPDEPLLSNVHVDGQYMHITANGYGVYTYDIRDPSMPEVVSQILPDALTGFTSASYSGHIGLLANSSQGLYSYDFSDPSNPTRLDFLDFGHTITSVSASGDLAIVGRPQIGMYLVDLSEPNALSIVHDLGADAGEFGWLLKEDRLYLGNDEGVVEIFSVSDPSNPILIGTIEFDAPIYPMLEEDGLLFAIEDEASFSDREVGFSIFDVRDPDHPEWLGFGQAKYGFGSLAYENGKLCALDIQHGLQLFDVSNPSNPTEIGYIGLGRTNASVAVQDGIAYMIERTDNVKIVNVSDQCDSCPVDFNDDRIMSFHDVSLFLQYFADKDVRADIKRDGLFNFYDIAEFLSLYHIPCHTSQP